ncbi:MAG: lysoplasmalogenase [Alphaproteobacteria bacterium]|nr:lysoplasmalogenase [Alphaproteobacteria bacterium]
MNQPDRYADAEPLIPDWAAPVYLAMSAIAATVYFGLDLVFAAAPGMAISKTLGIALLAAYAAFSRAPLLCLALVLSACGDYALAMTPPAREAGMAFFGSAHIAYIVMFALAIVRFGWRKDGLILLIALAAFSGALYTWLQPGLGAMAVPVTAYLGVILVMAALAALVNGPRLITLGAILFVLSDSLIAAGWFRGLEVQWGRFDLHGASIWITYYLAQIAIAVGVVRMKRAAAV